MRSSRLGSLHHNAGHTPRRCSRERINKNVAPGLAADTTFSVFGKPMLLGGLHGLFHIKIRVLFLEAFYTTSRIDEFLFTGVKRMTYAANIDFDAFGR